MIHLSIRCYVGLLIEIQTAKAVLNKLSLMYRDTTKKKSIFEGVKYLNVCTFAQFFIQLLKHQSFLLPFSLGSENPQQLKMSVGPSVHWSSIGPSVHRSVRSSAGHCGLLLINHILQPSILK